MTNEEHAARIGELAAELSMAIRNAATDGVFTEATVTMVGHNGLMSRRIPRINVKVK